MELTQDLTEKIWRYHSHGTCHLSYVFLRNCTKFSFRSQEGKRQRGLEQPLKAMGCPFTYAKPNESCLHWMYYIFTYYVLKPLRRRVLTGLQTDSNPMWGYSPPSPCISWRLHCLGPTQRRTLCLVLYEVKDYQLLLVSYKGWKNQVSYSGWISESRCLEISTQRKEGST